MLFRSDRKSTRLNSSHTLISYAVFCLKKKTIQHMLVNICFIPCFLHIRVTFWHIFFFFFNDTATTEIYSLSLHDALPIYSSHTLISHAEDGIRDESVTG